MSKKTFLLGIFFLSYLRITYSQTKYDISINFEGRTREFIVSVPTKNPPQNGYPLVIMLHGSSGDKNVFYNAKGWKELGQEENFVTVFPSALRWCYFEDGKKVHSTRFVCGRVIDSICTEDQPKLIDDVSFLKKIVRSISDTLPINPKKVFINGFSNGSCMSHKMAMEAGDIFAAAAGSSSPLHRVDSITPAKRIPFWFMLGTKDTRFTSTLFPTQLPYGGDSILLYMQTALNRALACQGLTPTFMKTETAINKTYIWKECQPGQICAPYIFTINKGQTHQFPNGTNYPVDAPRLFWDFFNNPPETILSSNNGLMDQNEEITIYPNPTSSTLTIVSDFQSKVPYQITISDANGKTVFYHQGINEIMVEADTQWWPPGIYFAMISRAQSSVVRKVIKL